MMHIRKPRTTALICSSGKLVVSGAQTKAESFRATRKFAKIIKKTGYEDVEFKGFMIPNVVGSFKVGFYINLPAFHKAHFRVCRYGPEVFPTLVYLLTTPKGKLQIYGDGCVSIVGVKTPQDIYDAFNSISPILKWFAK